MKFNSTIFSFLLIILLCIGCAKKNKADVEIVGKNPENWISLFNGKDLDDWTVKISGHPVNENIHNTFRVEDSVIKVSYDGYTTFGESYGHLFYNKSFSNYRLKLQYRFVGEQVSDGAGWATKNSGVMVHSQSPESMGLNQGFPVSLEVQFLGGIEEGVKRPTGNLCTPGTHVEMDGKLVTGHCINADADTFYGDEWIDVEVLVLKDSVVKHFINGKEVMRYQNTVYGGEYLPETEEWKNKDGTPISEGYIAIQSESHPIEFKNIKLLEIK